MSPQARKKRTGGAIIVVIVALIAVLVGGAIIYWNVGLSFYNKGVSAHNNLDPETAIHHYETVIRFYPASIFDFARLAAESNATCLAYQDARHAYDAGEYEKACQLYNQFLAQYPTNRLNKLVAQEQPAAFLDWARQDEQSGAYLQAVERYETLISAYPQSEQATEAARAIPAAYFNEADRLVVEQKYQDAIDIYQFLSEQYLQEDWAAQAHEAKWKTYAQWGDAIKAQGDYETAIAHYQDAITAGNAITVTQQMWQSIGDAYLEWADGQRKKGDYEAAIVICTQAIEAFPEAGWHEQVHTFIQSAYLEWADALYAKLDYKAAIAIYQNYLKAYPKIKAEQVNGKIVAAYDVWAKASWKDKDYAAALAAFEALIKAYPNDPRSIQAQGQLPQLHYDWAANADQKDDYETAVAHYKAGIALEEQSLRASGAISPTTISKTFSFTVNTDALNVRKGPGADQAVIGAAKRGDKLAVLNRNTDGTWLKIEKPAGWVSALLVKGETAVMDIPLEGVTVVTRPPVIEASPTAAQAWEKAAAALYKWGAALHKKADYQGAAAKFQTVIDQYAFSQVITDTRSAAGQSYLALGDVLSGTQKYENAAKAYESVFAVDPHGQWITQSLDSAAGAYLAWAESLYDQKSYSDAIDKYAAVYTNYPKSSLVNAAYNGVIVCYSDWGSALYQEGKYSDAVQKYQAIVTNFPKSSAAGTAGVSIGKIYNAWGAVLHGQKKYEEAMTKFSLAWQATADADVVTAAQKGYNDALWAIARLTDATGQKIINNALTTACAGQAAASPAVGIATEEAGKARASTNLFILPSDLAATMPAHFRYAICTTNGVNEVQRCPYTGGHTLIRQRLWWKVTVRNPKTGAWIAENTFYGSMPGSCPNTHMFYGSVGYLSGGVPSSESAVNWLKGIIK